jgi:hypothetical protein
MWLYTFESQFIKVTKKNGQQGHDYKGSLLYMTCKYDLNVIHLHLHV